jgi:hypothetical protein
MKESKKTTRTLKPLVEISASAENEKRSFVLSKTTWEILDQYVDFLKQYYNGSKVTPEQVIEARIKDLQRDRVWLSFRKNSTEK